LVRKFVALPEIGLCWILLSPGHKACIGN
jgi:hypothetical protein